MPATRDPQPPLTPDELRARFAQVRPFTVGLEEELMLLDPVTLDLAPVAAEALGRLGADPRFKPELPAAQLEIATTPATGAAEAVAQLAAARADLLTALGGTLARPAAAAVHPFAAPTGPLADGPRYDAIRAAYGPLAARQLVASLQVHVAVGGAARTLAVHDALRGFLPELAALAANGPFHDGADTGLASARPGICALLPRQGVPPALGSWERFAAALAWSATAAGRADPRLWWWELRPHPSFGTLELRVPDAQTTLADAAGVAAVAQALVAWLAERWEAGDLHPAEAAPPSWRIAENRFAALRHGVEGELADLRTGERRPARERLHRLLDELTPVAARLGSGALLPCARALVERNGAIRQREVAAERGLHGLVAWQAERFGDPLPAAPALAATAHRVPAQP
jgi:carboxylate-amine ligase